MGRLILMPSTGWKVRLISGFLGLLAALGTVAALRVAEYGLVEADIIIVTAAFILTYIGGWPVGLVTATIVTVYSLYGVLTPIPEMSASSSLQHSLLVALSTGLGVMLANWKRRHAENSASSLDSAMAALAEQRERRQAVEAALQEAEARLHLVLAHSPISLFAQDQRLRYIWCHAGDAPAKGNPHIGDTDHDWLPEPDAERITRYKRQVLETGTGIRCDEHVTIKGQPHDFVVSIEPMRDAEGNVRGLIGAAVEVTAERRAKDVARESEARFRLALQHGPIFMSTQDLDLRYTWAYGPRLGIKPEAVVGRTDAEIYAPEDASTLTTLKRGTLETGLGTRQMASVVFSGSPHVFDLIIEPLRDSSGTIQGLTCAAIDMTEEFARRDALEHARAEAERANQAKSRFFAAASHDLRQPFQAMRLFLHLLETRLTEPQQMELAAKLGDSLRAGEGLLNALLDISSLEAATVKPSVVSFPIQDLLRRLADEFAPQAAAKGLEWRTVACSQRISSDPTLLERMVRNLLANAVRYTQKGGILLGCRPCPSGVRIEVLDTGPGIPADKTTLIFEEFHQLDNAARDRTQGLGLGLAIVQRTGHLLGHKVDVRSRPGKGS
ncbi:MAG TPA: PAS domain-containing sensor histidine kinase, partial [Azospirillaceae bacterium]|nr:PAS domain-containing sensor histidine kinase [Azospirillaceae bacterium]